MDSCCICHSYDGRGRSVCGIGCPQHPIDGACPDCKTPIHGNRQCFECYAKYCKENRPESWAQLQRAYSHLIEAFQGLEWYATMRDRPRTDRDKEIPQEWADECRKIAGELRKHWQRVITLQMLEGDRVEWHEYE